MVKIELELNDEIIKKLRAYADGRNVSVEDFLATVINQRTDEIMPAVTKQWMPREKWDALVHGEDCPLCAELASTEPSNAYGYTVADLSFSRLRLAANQYVAGYCILICQKHIKEPYYLSEEEQAAYFADLMLVGQALEKAFGPVKMNFEILGNAVPHLHCHIKPRYYGDKAPGSPIRPDAEMHLLTLTEYDKRVSLIQGMLSMD